ncbi:PI-PLC X domain-containing protein [Pyrus ussuriensis x Pyrus communis]|uniref:PI-PLC X domain-containing protein n=1 Tax=Pyrus ussuriensis x Pyrus communis TaxID=2448454 RepID=A0A5N5I7U4_9ROSA|nr:PI-PLC X domain-containing protein [Pyrus ussuriensis x Pyrus communis]KAB2634601.1 PI-PLC X domain-containing protein [Pyrus ussuriensis x Pyrus communis]
MECTTAQGLKNSEREPILTTFFIELPPRWCSQSRQHNIIISRISPSLSLGSGFLELSAEPQATMPPCSAERDGGQCFNFTAFQPAINTLTEVETFLSQNPTEIVTIIIEDYVKTPKGLTTLCTNAGLNKYWFPVAKMPRKGEDWPTVTEMVRENHRLLVFTSDASKEAQEGVAYQWKYMVENEAGDPGVKPGSCPNASLFFQNYFPTYPVEAEACEEHSTPPEQMVSTCYKAAEVVPNFLVVNFYMKSDGGASSSVSSRCQQTSSSSPWPP